MSDSERYLMVQVDKSKKTEVPLATVSITRAGIISVLSVAEDSARPLLDTILQQVNSQNELKVKIPGQGQFHTATKPYLRSDADFLEGLKKYIQHFFSVELRPDGSERK